MFLVLASLGDETDYAVSSEQLTLFFIEHRVEHNIFSHPYLMFWKKPLGNVAI